MKHRTAQWPWHRLIMVLAAFAACMAAQSAVADDEPEQRQYTFSWLFTVDDEMRPRGGTSRGPAVELMTGESLAWRSLQVPGLSKFERDRRAILAMAGGYRTTFEFIETAGFTPAYQPPRPYRSWSTEYIDVIADEGTAITLQHTIVMEYLDREGNLRGPVVQKHWRQDWTYEDPTVHEFAGNGRWRERRPEPEAIQGLWSQAVYQVDDSPRYEAYGKWVHESGYSSWTSQITRRPLPRRESSVRDDYNVLIGTNRHTITPSGWVHEEDNLKAVLAPDGSLRADQPYLAREAGVNRYELIENFAFDARESYWSATGRFWSDVRDEWARIYDSAGVFEFQESMDGVPLFQPMFEYAAMLDSGETYSERAGRRFIRQTLERYVVR